MSEETVAAKSPEVAKAELDAMLAVTTPAPIEGPTLEQVLGLAVEHRGIFGEKGLTFLEPPMTLRRLGPFVSWLNRAAGAVGGAGDMSAMVEFGVAAAQQLLFVREGERLRAATRDEIEDNFGFGITELVQAALDRAGLKADVGTSAGEAPAPTGAAS